ncbi:D-sedoheptulose 7-phosphate isomerase [Actinomadura pelletieri DSM 43383]|uniref:D-sedoheptulose 7-phosphate isomerase n=1 Tax=Actinomadura pelletieri DSM 43383 TaxID=1120940 RepID=A0A495QXK3_9ACTN|nr:SIS domain-containing protein [Actinomadura pelletieri]RKS78797.1 D-sedoheptulose 7-phosphate isomerase [Actinomadura pelletieri DSM 43383]
MNPESLYPFLSPEQGASSGVLADVRASTEEKAAEIVALRESLADLYGARLVECARRMAACFRDGGRLFSFGNGGSATDAREIEELHVDPPPPARPLPAFSLPHDVATVTALANDVSFDVVFARRLAALAGTGDIAVGLSTSGGSENLLRAFEEANRRRMLTVGFAGYDGGRMAQAGTIDFLFVVPSSSVHRIQEAQTTLYHVLWELTQRALHGRL